MRNVSPIQIAYFVLTQKLGRPAIGDGQRELKGAVLGGHKAGFRRVGPVEGHRWS